MKKVILNLVGPSGAGKTTLGRELNKLGIGEIVSHTSRKPRNGEIAGIDYHFSTKEEIFNLIKNNGTLEHSNYCGDDIYCISKKEVEKKLSSKGIAFVITDIRGNEQLKKCSEYIIYTIFIFTTEDVLKKRLQNRGDSEDNIKQRMEKLAKSKELENYKYADFVILNKDFTFAKSQLFNIVDIIDFKEAI